MTERCPPGTAAFNGGRNCCKSLVRSDACPQGDDPPWLQREDDVECCDVDDRAECEAKPRTNSCTSEDIGWFLTPANAVDSS